MTYLEDKTIMVVDYGNFFPVAERLARDFGRVLYYIPWQRPFPKYHSYVVGTNVPNVERIYDLWKYYDLVDVFYFCDLFMGDLQEWLRSKGKFVYGAGKGEEMEIYRDRMKSLQRALGLPLNKYEVIRGLDGLREFLQDNDNKYIKTNLMRGHFESFKHDRYELTKPVLDKWEHTLGMYKNYEVFIVEDPIEALAEIGYDGFVADGYFPEKALFGAEKKNCAYIGVVVDYRKLPKPLLDINEKLADTFREYQYRGSYTNEVRLGVDRVGYLIDQTCRQPEPPTCLQLEIFDNYSEIVWEIAQGNVPKIKNKYKFGVQIILKSEWAKTEPLAIYFPSQFKNFVKIQNLTIEEGVHYYVPQEGSDGEEVGSVVGLGNTVEAAIDQAESIVKQVEAYGLEYDIDGLKKMQDEIDKFRKAGIKAFG